MSARANGRKYKQETKIFRLAAQRQKMNVYVGKTMHVGRPFVCANEINEGKPREEHHTRGPCEGHHTEATSEHQHRHKQTAMPTRTLSPQTHMLSYSRIYRIVLFLVHSPTHPHMATNKNTCRRAKRRHSIVQEKRANV